MPVTVQDRPVWDEYGLKESEGARYENGDENFTVTGYRLQDTTGAMAAFDWQRPAASTVSHLPVALAPLAAETADHAIRVLAEQECREQLSEAGVPMLSLPRLVDGADLGGVYELADDLAEQGVGR